MKKCKNLWEAKRVYKKITGYNYGDKGAPREPAIRNWNRGKVYKYIVCNYFEWLEL